VLLLFFLLRLYDNVCGYRTSSREGPRLNATGIEDGVLQFLHPQTVDTNTVEEFLKGNMLEGEKDKNKAGIVLFVVEDSCDWLGTSNNKSDCNAFIRAAGRNTSTLFEKAWNYITEKQIHTRIIKKSDLNDSGREKLRVNEFLPCLRFVRRDGKVMFPTEKNEIINDDEFRFLQSLAEWRLQTEYKPSPRLTTNEVVKLVDGNDEGKTTLIVADSDHCKMCKLYFHMPSPFSYVVEEAEEHLGINVVAVDRAHAQAAAQQLQNNCLDLRPTPSFRLLLPTGECVYYSRPDNDYLIPRNLHNFLWECKNWKDCSAMKGKPPAWMRVEKGNDKYSAE